MSMLQLFRRTRYASGRDLRDVTRAERRCVKRQHARLARQDGRRQAERGLLEYAEVVAEDDEPPVEADPPRLGLDWKEFVRARLRRR